MLSPFSDFNRTFAQFDRLFGLPAARPAPRAGGPRFQVEETDGAWLLHGLLPGWSAGDLEITVEDGVLTLTGERSTEVPAGYRPLRQERRGQHLERTLRLSDDIDVDAISARSHEGVLTVTLPRRTPAAPRREPVQAG